MGIQRSSYYHIARSGVFSIEKAKRLLEYQPKYTCLETIDLAVRSYEVAATLAEQLQRETQAKVDLKSIQAIFPTITKFGIC